jgi:hypothetical protein
LCQPEGIADGDDPYLLTVGTDEPDLGNTDPVVDAWLVADGASSWDVSVGQIRRPGERPEQPVPTGER